MEIQIINQISLPKSYPPTSKIIINDYDTVSDLKRIILRTLPRTYSINRLNLHYINPITNQTVTLSSLSKPLLSYPHFKEHTKVYLSDSGIQINSVLCNLIQYLFPLIHIIMLYYNESLHPKLLTQRLCMLMSTTHFVKKIMQSLFVKNNNVNYKNTESLNNLILKCIFYWVLYAIVCGYEIFNNKYTEPDWSAMRYVFSVIFFICEYFNFVYSIMHMTNKKTGIMFKYVYCPFNLFEVLSWVSFTIFSGSISLLVFTCGISYKLITDSIGVKEEEELKYKKSQNENNKQYRCYNVIQDRKFAIIPYLL